MGPPTFREALKTAEARLRREHPGATIEAHTSLTPNLLRVVLQVDEAKFREELRYTAEEVEEQSRQPGFILILALSNDAPLGFAYGYDYPAGGFFLDELASMEEGRGIGRLLEALLVLYAYERGHSTLTLYTEERDEKGRLLRRFYERAGFRYLGTEDGKGDVMRLDLAEPTVSELIDRYVS